ncbi:hypothetical protein C0Q70_05158 [Pomacea canaliculata]|uniref:Fork-head domain-containing protein n=1 Tax=Pomacea canaliculata TaxID=400727 RepID=A0A2T7PKD4_POMCA|nr:hypothetical protein C0Q70_05158 [Pomacea canaliculata]
MKGMKVKEICKWIEDNFPYYRHRISSGWKSTIRQNLSMYSCFEKVNDPSSSKKNGSYWICKAEKAKSCTQPTKSHRSGGYNRDHEAGEEMLRAHRVKISGLPAYAVVCLPVAPSSASLSSITFPESSSVGLQSSAVNALPTSMTTNPVVLPVPKLPIP